MNSTDDAQHAATGVQPPEKVVIRVWLRGAVEVFDNHELSGDLDGALRTVVNYFDKVGTVLTVHGTAPPRLLFQSMADASDLGVH